MRDAFGGVFMMRLMLVFIVVFVGFGAISLNYAKAFRIKNKVIDLVEQQQIIDVSDILKSTKNYTEKLDKIIDNADYRITCDNKGNKQIYFKDDKDRVIGICYRGITITMNNEHAESDSIYYNVITYGGWNLGFLNMILAVSDNEQDSQSTLSGRWKVTGEAKVSGIPYSDPIDGMRYHRPTKTWVKVIKCQPVEARGGKCLLDTGRYVVRSKLSNSVD